MKKITFVKSIGKWSFPAALFLFITFLSATSLSAQTPEYSYTQGTAANSIPLGGGGWGSQKNQWLYPPGDFGGAVPGGMAITKIYIRSGGNYPQSTYSNFHVLLGQSNITTLSAPWETGLDTVKNTSTFVVNATVAQQWIEIELDQPFLYDPNKPLIVETYQTATTGGIALMAGGVPLNPAYSGAFTQLYGAVNAATGNRRTYSYHFGFDLVPQYPNNAGVQRVDSPDVFCAGRQDVYATITNNGTNQIDSVNVFWEVDGVPQGSLSYKSLLDTINGSNPSTAMIRLGDYNFTSNSVIKVYTDLPNGVNDTLNLDDTLTKNVGPAMAGVYTVNANLPASSTNFTTISDMTDALSSYGICGPTNIVVASDRYNERMNLSNIPGLTATNTLTIDGGDSSKTIITQNGTLGYATLVLSNVEHVTVKNFRIEHTGTSGCAILFHEADTNTVSSCISWVDPTSTSSAVNNILFSATATSNASPPNTNRNTVEHTKMIGGYYGVRLSGSTTQLPSGNKFLFNEMDSMIYYGIYAYYSDFTEFRGNKVDMTKRDQTNSQGALFYYTANVKVIGNDIKSLGNGVSIYNYQAYTPYVERRQVINNMINSKDNYGLYIYYTDSVDILHNTVYSRAASQPAVYIQTSPTIVPLTSYDVRNNIFIAESNLAFAMYEPVSAFDKFDFNIFNTGGNILMRLDNVNYTSLATQQAALPAFNGKSLEGNPQFVSPLDLHLVGTLANDVGDTTVKIYEDIDLEVRPHPLSTIVDIGADEYEPPNCPPPLITEMGVEANVFKAKFVPNDMTHVIEFELVECGDTLGSGISATTTNVDSIVFANLKYTNCYEFYIREACDRGDTSIWSGPYEVQTLLRPAFGVNCEIGRASG